MNNIKATMPGYSIFIRVSLEILIFRDEWYNIQVDIKIQREDPNAYKNLLGTNPKLCDLGFI